jgi:hypothetical protein
MESDRPRPCLPVGSPVGRMRQPTRVLLPCHGPSLPTAKWGDYGFKGRCGMVGIPMKDFFFGMVIGGFFVIIWQLSKILVAIEALSK